MTQSSERIATAPRARRTTMPPAARHARHQTMVHR